MTSGELVPFKAAAGAFASMVAKLARGWTHLTVVPAAEAKALRVHMEFLVTAARMRAVGELARTQVREIEKTYRLIEELNFEGPVRDIAMQTLVDLSSKLAQQLDGFDRRWM